MAFETVLARVRGMCRGVDRAIRVVEVALERHGDKVYVLHEVVHNRHVVEDLKKGGAHFVDSLDEVPEGSVLIFSAHGVGLETEKKARERGFKVIDATCPVVSHIHKKMNLAGEAGKDAVVIGHPGHQEVIGTIGQYKGEAARVHVILTPEDARNLSIDGDNAIFATQTTLSVDETAQTVAALREKYPRIMGPRRDDTCAATQDRQEAVRELARLCDIVIIAGSANSSNSNRLREVAEKEGTKAYLVDDSAGIDPVWLSGVSKVGVSAGASAPEYVITDILDFLEKQGSKDTLDLSGDVKDHPFPLPAEI